MEFHESFSKKNKSNYLRLSPRNRLLLVFILLISILVVYDSPGTCNDDKKLIHRAVLINNRLWIIKHPMGSEAFNETGTDQEVSKVINLDKVLDVAPYYEDKSDTLIIKKSLSGYEILLLNNENVLQKLGKVGSVKDELFIRLFTTENGNLILTSKRIIDLKEPKNSKNLRFDNNFADDPDSELLNRKRLISNHVIMGNELILGLTVGEFGGGYISINLKDYLVRIIKNMPCSTDLLVDKSHKQSFFLSTGMTHISSSTGSILKIQSGYPTTIFLGNNYLRKLLGFNNVNDLLINNGLPVVGMFYDKKDLCCVVEQNYILNITSPERELNKQIKYKDYGNYKMSWVHGRYVIVNCEYFLPFIDARVHTRSSEYAASNPDDINGYINQTIIVARQD